MSKNYIGDKQVVAEYIGDKKVIAEYIGSDLVWADGATTPSTWLPTDDGATLLAWYEFDPPQLSSDINGVEPITTDGEVFARVLDKSGNGNHATQSLVDKRPTYKLVDGKHLMELDSIDDLLNLPLSLKGKTITIGIAYTSADSGLDFMLLANSAFAPWGIWGVKDTLAPTRAQSSTGAGVTGIRARYNGVTKPYGQRGALYDNIVAANVAVFTASFDETHADTHVYGMYRSNAATAPKQTACIVIFEGEVTTSQLDNYLASKVGVVS